MYRNFANVSDVSKLECCCRFKTSFRTVVKQLTRFQLIVWSLVSVEHWSIAADVWSVCDSYVLFKPFLRHADRSDSSTDFSLWWL